VDAADQLVDGRTLVPTGAVVDGQMESHMHQGSRGLLDAQRDAGQFVGGLADG
jgi:hypothetical protein